MSDIFHLLDLPSQALAVRRLLSGQPDGQKLSWLGARGKLASIDVIFPGARTVYHFESALGLQCAFFFDGDEFVFLGDNTTYTVKS
jgi:hypothetical protein